MSVPSNVLVWQYQRPNKISFITSNKWANLKTDLFYTKQIAYKWVFKDFHSGDIGAAIGNI